jgi:DNA-binding NarL/FixJ family response regulator
MKAVNAPASATILRAVTVPLDASHAATGRRDDGDQFGSRSGHGVNDPHPAGVRTVPLQILVAEDHQMVRQGIRAILERHGFQVVCEAANGREAVRLAQAHSPDVAILDLSMPQLNGLDAAREILQSHSPPAIILLTMHVEEHQIVDALRAGIRGYVIKTQASGDLINAIREVVAGGWYLSPGAYSIVVDAYLAGRNAPSDRLTLRERQVLQLVSEGHTTKEIAAILNLSVKTAESHRSQIMEKLEIHDTAGLVRYAIRRGLIQP